MTHSPKSVKTSLPDTASAGSLSEPARGSVTQRRYRRGSAATQDTSSSTSSSLRQRASNVLATAVDTAVEAPPASVTHVVLGRSSSDGAEPEPEDLGNGIGVDDKEATKGDSGDEAEKSPKQPPGLFTKLQSSLRRRTLCSPHLILPLLTLFGIVLSLDRLLSSSLQTLAANSLSAHSSLAFLSILRSSIAALAGPPFAVLESKAGGGWAWGIGAALYVLGHVVSATTGVSGSKGGIAQYALGVSLLELGANGVLVLQQSLVARITTPRDRALGNLLPQFSFVVWAFVSADIFAGLDGKWRWGVGLFAIAGAIVLGPIVGVVGWGEREQREVRRRGSLTPREEGTSEDEAEGKNVAIATVAASSSTKDLATPLHRGRLRRLLASLHFLIIAADLPGLLLLSSATLGILLPITLAGQSTTTSRWLEPQLLVPLLTSTFLLLPALIYWELRLSPQPLLPRSLLTSRTFLLASLAQLTIFAAVGCMGTYLPTYLYVAKHTTAKTQQNVSSIFNFCYALASLPFAIAVRYWRRAKGINVMGAGLFTAGVGVMIWTSSSATPLFGMIAGLVVTGVGAAASVAIIPSVVQVEVQRRQARARQEAQPASKGVAASTTLIRQDDHVVKAVAALNIANCLGSALGAGVAGTIWSSLMRDYLTTSLTAVSSGSADEVNEVYAQPLTWIASHAVGTGERIAVVDAYDKVWRIMLIAATALAVLGVAGVVGMPALKLGDAAEDGGDEGSEKQSTEAESSESGAGLLCFVRSAWRRLTGAAR